MHTNNNSTGKAGQDYVACLYDVKQASEPVTAPHVRIGPCSKDRIVKLICAFIKARNGDGPVKDMKSGDAIIMLDGGKRGNATRLMAPFKELGLGKRVSRKAVTLFYGEESVKQHKLRAKGISALRQQETMHIVAATAYNVPERKKEAVPRHEPRQRSGVCEASCVGDLLAHELSGKEGVLSLIDKECSAPRTPVAIV